MAVQQTNLDSIELHDDHLKSLGHRGQTDSTSIIKRWLMLGLFSAATLINGFHWIYLSSISNLVVEYYDISIMMVNATSLVYMLVYIVAIIPALFFTERFGLRQSIVAGSCGNLLAVLIKLFSAEPATHGFAVFMVGQFVASASQLFLLGMPPLIANLWFPRNQMATANAIGVFSNQLGIAMGFLVPVWLLGDATSSLRDCIQKLHAGLTVITMVVTLLILLLFEDRQQVAIKTPVDGRAATVKTWTQFLRLIYSYFRDKGFPILIVTYGIYVGASYSFSTLLNQLIVPSFPDNLSLVGRLGLVFVVSGMAGCLISGPLIDHTKAYQSINIVFYGLGLVSYGLFALAIKISHLMLVHISTGLVGFLLTAQLVIGTETANQLCKSKPENISSGLLNQSSQIFGVLLTIVGSKTVETFDHLAANLFCISVLLVGFILTLRIKIPYQHSGLSTTDKQCAYMLAVL